MILVIVFQKEREKAFDDEHEMMSVEEKGKRNQKQKKSKIFSPKSKVKNKK